MVRVQSSILINLTKLILRCCKIGNRIGIERIRRGGVETGIHSLEVKCRICYGYIVVLEREGGEGDVDVGTWLGKRHDH